MHELAAQPILLFYSAWDEAQDLLPSVTCVVGKEHALRLLREAGGCGLAGMGRHLQSRLSVVSSLLGDIIREVLNSVSPSRRGKEWAHLSLSLIPAQESFCRDHILPHFLSLQDASGPRVFCVPQIILTECTSSSPTLPETTLEELGPRTVPTPRPRTLVGSGKAWNGPQALLGLAAEILWPRSSSVFRKGPAILQKPHSVEARVLCLQGPSPDASQKTLTVETHSEETPPNSVRDTQACSRGPRAIRSGSTVHDATLLRMDSLEETLQELETTLSEMSAKSTMTSPGSPRPLQPHPQVAATLSFSLAAFLLQALRLQCGRAGP